MGEVISYSSWWRKLFKEMRAWTSSSIDHEGFIERGPEYTIMGLESVVLSERFTYRSDTHEYCVRWTSIGPDYGPPLIFVHGTPWSSYVWQPYAKALSSRYKIYLFDNPGFGESPGGRPLLVPTSTTGDGNKIPELDASLGGQAEAFAALYHSWNFTTPDRLPQCCRA